MENVGGNPTVSARLGGAEMKVGLMAISSATASGIANVYNMSSRLDPVVGDRHAHRWELDQRHVMQTWWILSLLLSTDRTSLGQRRLTVPHHACGNDRLEGEMVVRNMDMTGTGQPMYGHTCQGCMKCYKGSDGKICESLVA